MTLGGIKKSESLRTKCFRILFRLKINNLSVLYQEQSTESHTRIINNSKELINFQGFT